MTKVEKKQAVNGDVIIVGIDVAKRKHYARIFDQMGLDVIKPFQFNNNKDGYYRLVSKIIEAQEKTKANKIIIGMEPTGHYWKTLAWFLKEQGYTVVIVNPYHVKRRKEEEDNTPRKNDKKDAGIIADLVKNGKFLNLLLPSGIYADLRNLTVTRRQLKQQLNSALNRLYAILDEYFPEFEQIFKNLLGKASLWVLKHCPFPSMILSQPVENLAEKLKEASSHKVGLKRAIKLYEAAKESIGAKEGLNGAQIKLKTCLDEIEFYNHQLENIQQAMIKILDKIEISYYLLSIPGIGVITVASFLGETGDLERFEHWKQIQALAGLNFTEQSSGEHKGQTKITKRGRPELRNILYQASMTLVAKNQNFKALYQYSLHRSQNPLKKKQALIAISLKLLRVMFGLARKKQNYDPKKVLGEYRINQIKQAA
jgi:transposase